MVQNGDIHLEDWLSAYIADLLGCEKNRVDATKTFDQHGLDSVAILGMLGDIEVILDRKLPRTIVLDFPTIQSLARQLDNLSA